jgi:hypothetical protein
MEYECVVVDTNHSNFQNSVLIGVQTRRLDIECQQLHVSLLSVLMPRVPRFVSVQSYHQRMTRTRNLSGAAQPPHVSLSHISVDGSIGIVAAATPIPTKVLALDAGPIPSSLLGAVVFFGLLAIIAWLLIRETLRIVLKPALVFILLALLAVWAGLLDGTVVEGFLSWMGDRLILAVTAISEWAVGAFETVSGSAPASS